MGQYKSDIGWSLWNIIGEGNESQDIFRIGSNNASLGASNIEGEGGAGGCVSGGLWTCGTIKLLSCVGNHELKMLLI
jgi:hypothetical protein